MALQVDMLIRIAWLSSAIAMANGLKESDLLKAPDPIPRPGDEPEELVFSSNEEVMMFLGQGG